MTTLLTELTEAETALSLAQSPEEQKVAQVRLKLAQQAIEDDRNITRAFNRSKHP